MIIISDKQEHKTFIKILCFSQYFHLESKFPQLTVARHLSAGTFHQLLLFPERSVQVLLPSPILLLNCPYQLVPALSGQTLWTSATGMTNSNGAETVALLEHWHQPFSVLPLPGLLTIAQPRKDSIFKAFQLKGQFCYRAQFY